MLLLRLISATGLISVLFGLAWLDLKWHGGRPGIWLLPLVILLSLLGTIELLRMLERKGFALSQLLVTAVVLGVQVAAAVPVWCPCDPGQPSPFWTLLAFAAIIVFLLTLEAFQYDGSPDDYNNGEFLLSTRLVRLAITLLIVSYIGVLTSFLITLRTFQSNEIGMLALLSVIICTKASDTGAYLVGRKLGRRKLAPRLSPGKTIEGALGGFLLACLGAWMVKSWLGPIIGVAGVNVSIPWNWLVFGLLIAIAGLAGDLTESLIKREFECKDSGNLLPGMGGILDVLDSLLFSAPVGYLCWAFGLIS